MLSSGAYRDLVEEMNGDSAHSAAARPRMAAPNSALPADPPADADVPKSVRLHRLDRVNVAQVDDDI